MRRPQERQRETGASRSDGSEAHPGVVMRSKSLAKALGRLAPVHPAERF